MTWSWEFGLLVVISVLAFVLALIAWRRRYIADLLEASLNATHQGRQVVDRSGAVKFDNGAFRRLFGEERRPLNAILEQRAFDAAARAAVERFGRAERIGAELYDAWHGRSKAGEYARFFAAYAAFIVIAYLALFWSMGDPLPRHLPWVIAANALILPSAFIYADVRKRRRAAAK